MVFFKNISIGNVIVVDYVDDALRTSSVITLITLIKAFLYMNLTIQDFGAPRYPMGSEYAYWWGQWILNQWKY